MIETSVVIPVYNEISDIKECLDSLAKQKYRDFDVIVVDDGSTDGTLKLLESYKAGYSLTLLKQSHKGAGAARNRGSAKAKGKFLVFVDSDMAFDPDFLGNLIKPIKRGEAIGTFSKEEYLKNAENVWALCWNINRGFPRNRMHPVGYSDRQKVFRAILKSEFEKAGGFDEKGGYADDGSLSERLGTEAVNAENAVFYHKNPGSLGEAFKQSKWMAKRHYKLSYLGFIAALLRVSFPVSLIKGTFVALKEKMPAFIIFKIITDFAQFVGILEYALFGKVSK